MATIHPINTIVSAPAVRNGRAVIEGTQIAVIDLIASYLYRELSPDELAVNYSLDMGQVYSALAYYHQHKAAIEAQIRDEAATADSLLEELDQQGKLIRFEWEISE